MKRFFHFAFSAFLFSIVLLTGDAFAIDLEEMDKSSYESDRYDNYRKITYWGRALLVIRDYQYGSGDAEYLKLVVRDRTKKIEKYNPREDMKQHFMGEFKRLFVERFKAPFYDDEIGYDERFKKFSSENKELNILDLFEKWKAYEVARRRAQYGGHPGSIFCRIAIKRRNFPVLYEIECNMSAKEDLWDDPWDSGKKDIGFSSPEYIDGELKNAITEMLKDISVELSKIKKYGG